MCKYGVEYSKEAKQDLIEIKKYIKEILHQPKAAQKITCGIIKQIDSLKENPKIYSIIDGNMLDKLQIRKFIVYNYIVFYRLKNNRIQIIRVLYGRRNWINLL